ncbi:MULTISPECIES: hypothetical protein [Cupriavidus]|uniref:Uncharacterized protein n=4 Tax=Cupriavidus TaxID=106589 RepID=A0A375CSQ7_9BURK|nr:MULTISPECIES: hypothetical protein [Cupriavidus]MCO4865749.1 hypothetical protein [Cupriavidus sp. WGlv3]MCO4893392.1 hypothetical protein [Cupriavidus sp. WGtm5]ULX56109.1 hypothetical protein A9P79_29555 [Cupriavidus taiwanensis]CAP63866.1 conserved hypothetical protein [Cupriavidus taiwanensis LMG 19424]SOY74092.1 conserved hypothetical protein [Cupriavidus taiwanensis]
MGKLAIKVTLNPMTTPQLYAQLAQVNDPRLRAEVFRRLAEVGAQVMGAKEGVAATPAPAGALLTTLMYRSEAAFVPPQNVAAVGQSAASTPRAQLVREEISRDAPADIEVPAVPAPSALDLSAMNSAMSRFFD